jgi:hypothetical protein
MAPRNGSELYRSVGQLEAGVSQLQDAFAEERRQADAYRKEMREAISALSEAVRILTDRSDAMEPHVFAYAEHEAEARGRAKLRSTLHGAWMAVSGLIGVTVGALLTGKLWQG